MTTSGISLIEKERNHQLAKGYSVEQDVANHADGSLLGAAAEFIDGFNGIYVDTMFNYANSWPSKIQRKLLCPNGLSLEPTPLENQIRILAIAGALIAAEIDRMLVPMKVKIWLDDERPAPEGWTHVKTYEEFCAVVKDKFSLIEEMSLDHDLGQDKTGLHCLSWLLNEKISAGDYKLPDITVHSQNPVGRKNMLQAITSFHRWVELMT